jgi:hypothetical protein
MDYAEIRKYYFARPFRPFNVITKDGRAARVLHPEFMALDGNEQVIMVTDPEASQFIIDADSITALEYPRRVNGKPPRKRKRGKK